MTSTDARRGLPPRPGQTILWQNASTRVYVTDQGQGSFLLGIGSHFGDGTAVGLSPEALGELAAALAQYVQAPPPMPDCGACTVTFEAGQPTCLHGCCHYRCCPGGRACRCQGGLDAPVDAGTNSADGSVR